MLAGNPPRIGRGELPPLEGDGRGGERRKIDYADQNEAGL